MAQAQRKPRNRPAGTLEMKPTNVTRDIYRSFLVEKVLLAIREKWPSSKCQTIGVQQDNARPHVSVRDDAIVDAGKVDSWNIRLKCQTANSPDLNVLDLVFYNSIQSLQHETVATRIDDLAKAVEEAFIQLSNHKLADTFQTM
eukprot:IDg4483t1